MSVHSDLFAVGARHHDDLLQILVDLEAVAVAHQDGEHPREADQLLRSIWPFLKAYGRRDHRGVVDEDIALPPVPWVPSAAQLAAHAAGLPIPPDEDDER